MMTDKNWEVMNKLEESFSNINTINFMLEELKEAMDSVVLILLMILHAH